MSRRAPHTRRTRSIPGLIGVLACVAVLSCNSPPSSDAATSASASSSSMPPVSPAAHAMMSELGDAASWASCGKARSMWQVGASPTPPWLDEHRPELVGRVRGSNVMWRRAPVRAAGGERALNEAMDELETSRNPLAAARNLVRKGAKTPAALRAVVLREGYIYDDDVERALALVETLHLTHLFDEPAIMVLRDGHVHRLRRVPKERYAPERYVHDDGPMAGETAEILFGDRLGLAESELLRDALAVDFSAAQDHWGFDRIRNPVVAGNAMAAEVRYGGKYWAPIVFDVDHGNASVTCHELTPELARNVAEARAIEVPSLRAFAAIREVIQQEVREQLPFDVPRGGADDGEGNGPLRTAWEAAYSQSIRTFPYKGKRYRVYDDQGRPIPPQVCIDFVFDTWERASGTWYGPMARGDGGVLAPAPRRVSGRLHVDDLAMRNRRSVAEFLRYAELHPMFFDVWHAPAQDRVPFQDRAAFFAFVGKYADEFRRGDVLVLHGYKDGGRPHYHSLIVMETDPFTGIPALLAGNAGRPRIQTLEGVMQISPQRTIRHRMRGTTRWLDAAILGEKAK